MCIYIYIYIYIYKVFDLKYLVSNNRTVRVFSTELSVLTLNYPGRLISH